MVRLKRIYEDPVPEDGLRVLVDRLWPRGVSREAARVDRWLRELAPSTELRKWFGHDPERFEAFRTKYERELTLQSELLASLREEARSRTVTLLFGARDVEHNNAVVLKRLIDE